MDIWRCQSGLQGRMLRTGAFGSAKIKFVHDQNFSNRVTV